MASDLDLLMDMGFDRERSVIALERGGSLTSAFDFLNKNADKTLMELIEEDDPMSTGLAKDSAPNSLVCNECNKKCRNMTQAQAHAEKTGHDDWAESSEVIPPLTEEEKAVRLAELKAKLAAKRAERVEGDSDEEAHNSKLINPFGVLAQRKGMLTISRDETATEESKTARNLKNALSCGPSLICQESQSWFKANRLAAFNHDAKHSSHSIEDTIGGNRRRLEQARRSPSIFQTLNRSPVHLSTALPHLSTLTPASAHLSSHSEDFVLRHKYADANCGAG